MKIFMYLPAKVNRKPWTGVIFLLTLYNVLLECPDISENDGMQNIHVYTWQFNKRACKIDIISTVLVGWICRQWDPNAGYT